MAEYKVLQSARRLGNIGDIITLKKHPAQLYVDMGLIEPFAKEKKDNDTIKRTDTPS